MAAAAISLIVLDGLRRGGLALIGGGLVCGLALWFFTQSRMRLLAATALTTIALLAIVLIPSWHERVLTNVTDAAKIHAGHVFTVGHVYKLMDPGFYVTPQAPAASDIRLTDAEALRFLTRATISFFVTPWPWQMRSTGELALLPEHVIWYLIVLLLPFGVSAGWRTDPMATALFIGFAIPTAAVVAVTNGNIGTLFRLRGLVTPFLVWISAIGLCAILDRLAAPRLARAHALMETPAL